MKVNISEVESFDNYPPGTIFVWDKNENDIMVPDALKIPDQDKE